MAGVSKVTYGDEVLLDLTGDTVTPNSMLPGVTAHAANGDRIVGALALGALAYLSSIDYNSNYLTGKPTLGNLASKNLSDLDLKALAHQDDIDYESDQLKNKPHLGALASRDFIEWSSPFLTNKPDFRRLAFQDDINYESDQLKNKPVFGDFAWLNSISYESDKLTDKPRLLADIIDDLSKVYPDLPKGIKTVVSMGSGDLCFDGLFEYQDNGIHVYEEYTDWFTYINGSNESGIQITIHEKLTDFVEPILGDLAHQDEIDYQSDQLKNKPHLGRLAAKDIADYDTDIINKPASAGDVITSIMEVYPDLPSGISFAVYSIGDHAINLSNAILTYDGAGMIFDPENAEGITSTYISEDSGMRFVFPQLQFIQDVPDDNKLYARRYGEWVEINV